MWPKDARPAPTAGSFSRWWWLVPAQVGVAAFVAVGVFLSGQPAALVATPEVKADEPPVKVERRDVDLTVLSVSETEGETLYMPILQQLGSRLTTASNPLQAAAQQAAWAGYGYRPQPAVTPTGQALVKDHRLVLNLKEGENVVRFTGVAATIDPTSVRFVSNTDPEGTEVAEQNFEYDLVNADALLKRYIDRQVTCVFKDGRETNGYLASFDDRAIVLTSEPPAVPTGKASPRGKANQKTRNTQTLSRRQLQALRLGEPPAGLLVKPTLVWKLRARKAGRHEVTVSYLCGFIRWQADYVALVRPAEGVGPDRLSLTGWVSLDNLSGATYDRAGLKLIAGDVNRVRDPWAPPPPMLVPTTAYAHFEKKGADKPTSAAKEFVEKSFFEYHLYTLTAPSTVRDQQTKQLNLLRRDGVKAARRYLFDPNLDPRRCAIELVARNEKENGLGLPLPKGQVTFEQPDQEGELQFLGKTEIDHTAVKEELTLRYGYAFDVVGEFKQLNYQQPNPRHSIVTQEIRVRNHKSGPARVRAVAHLGSNWKVSQTSLPFEQHDFQTVYFNFLLQPNSEQVITYTVEYEY